MEEEHKDRLVVAAPESVLDELQGNEILKREKRKIDGKKSRDRVFVSRKCNKTTTSSSRHMYENGFEERRDLEQYFWTDKTIHGILDAVRFTFGYDGSSSCCLCTPTVAHTWWVEGGQQENQSVNLLDIDTRFDYLPKFRYFDLRTPEESMKNIGKEEQSIWRVIVFDPPFFYIPLPVLYEAVLTVCQGKIEQTKLLLGFLKREEDYLLNVFRPFQLKRTNFSLEYAHVKSNKWTNYAMYSNVDLPGIKRIKTA